MIEARIVLDSINPAGNRLTTWLLTYPRFIHSEFMTHRVFSRNAASSRAIPISKMLEAIEENPAWPEQWGSKQKGMQAGPPLNAEEERFARMPLENLRQSALDAVRIADGLNLHKQVANRYLEPWAHMTVLATATDHSNFFKLRAHPAAQPEFQVLAYRMLAAYIASEPKPVAWGEWHLPGFDYDAGELVPIEERLHIVTALAARASYSAFDDGVTPEKAKEIHDKLRDSGHWSPFEHAAQAISDEHLGKCHPAFRSYPWSNFDFPGNGGPSQWGQYRKTFPQECARNDKPADLAAILAGRSDWVKV